MVEEDEYRSTYHSLAENRCVFEKALSHQYCQCSQAVHFWLADREGYACGDPLAADKCSELLQNLRENSRFSLKLHSVGNKLPHNMDIKVQVGGLTGLASVLTGEPQSGVDDVVRTVDTAEQRYGDIEALPWSEIVQSIARFKGRQRRRRSGPRKR